MNDAFMLHGKQSRRIEKVSNLHHFQVEIFYQMIDRQLQELNNRFTEVNSELLICVASLSLRDSFFAFDKEKLINLTRFYPSEVCLVELMDSRINLKITSWIFVLVSNFLFYKELVIFQE